VIVINEALAKRLLEGGRIANPVGRNIQLTYIDYSGQPSRFDGRIAGVMRSERVGNPWRPDPPVAYVPLAQAPVRSLNLLVHTRGDADAVPAIREAIRAIDPDLPLGAVSTMEEVRERTFLPFSRPAWLIGIFAAVAALLAALGLYGVLAQSVTDRRHELGIRLALGAASRTMVGHIVGQAFRMIAAGLAIGLVGSIVLTRALRGLLFGVSPLDPGALAAAAAVIMGVGLTAALIPARRAARLDPITALRDEG
jgi:hypothetical protein